MRILQLLVQALLYYLACSLVAKQRENAPGLLRVLFIVVILAFVSGGVRSVIGVSWFSTIITAVVSFFILWVGLGVGFFRTIIAALIVALLRKLLEYVFSGGQPLT